MISLAMQDYAARNVDKAQQQIVRATTIDPPVRERLDEILDALCHCAISLPIPDPVSYTEKVLEDLPPEADHLKRIRSYAINDMLLACAFRDYEAKQRSGVIRHVMGAARYRPVVFKNRGVISIFLKSILALLYPGRFA